jgi:hypothetical protein
MQVLSCRKNVPFSSLVDVAVDLVAGAGRMVPRLGNMLVSGLMVLIYSVCIVRHLFYLTNLGVAQGGGDYQHKQYMVVSVFT